MRPLASSRHFFEGVRETVRKYELAKQHYNELCLIEIKGINYEGGAGGSGTSDPMAHVDERLNYIEVVRKRQIEAEKALDEAANILYGNDGRSGLAKLKGTIYADCICAHYLQLESWHAIACNSNEFDAKTARNYAMAGFRFIDKHGMAKMKAGEL